MTTQIAVFVHHPECSIESAHGILRALAFYYNVEYFGIQNISDKFFDQYDIIAFPGGIGDSNKWYEILYPYKETIRRQVKLGKRYLGICMGAYWAGSHYFNLLDRVDPVQYIKRPGADIRRSFGTVADVSWLGESTKMYFYDGCSLVSKGGRFRTIASYSNGDPAAIIQNNVGVIGPHPESDLYWYKKPYMQSHWHEYRHHELLLDFVNRLVK